MQDEITKEHLEVLLEDILNIYGYDFTGYNKNSLNRRINRLFSNDRFNNFAEFRYKLTTDESYLNRFIAQVMVNVTAMFRDPLFFKNIRQEIIPILATYPFIRIWHAGCCTGEEVYSMAILLKEANLLHKSLIYATDINPEVVQKAAEGVISFNNLQKYSTNYKEAGGNIELQEYFERNEERYIIKKELKKNIVFSTHNLAAESSFNQFQIILCRNVLIYFEKNLQHKVLELFHNSLDSLGFLALGTKETLKQTPYILDYHQFGKEKIWRKVN